MKGVRFVIRPEGRTVASDRRASFRKDLLPLAPRALVYDPPGREPKNRSRASPETTAYCATGLVLPATVDSFRRKRLFFAPREKRSSLALNRKMSAIA